MRWTSTAEFIIEFRVGLIWTDPWAADWLLWLFLYYRPIVVLLLYLAEAASPDTRLPHSTTPAFGLPQPFAFHHGTRPCLLHCPIPPRTQLIHSFTSHFGTFKPYSASVELHGRDRRPCMANGRLLASATPHVEILPQPLKPPTGRRCCISRWCISSHIDSCIVLRCRENLGFSSLFY